MAVNLFISNFDFMREFIKILQAIIFIVFGLFIADFCIGRSVGYLMLRLPDHGGEICEVNYAINRACPDIVILGSSRANHHYNCSIISDKFGKTVYNAGIDGTNILYSRCVLQQILSRKIPDMVVLELNVGCLFDENTVDIKQCRLFADMSPDLESIVQQYGMSQSLYVNSYRYNSSVLNILSNIILQKKHAGNNNGFIPLANTNLYSGLDWEYRNIDGVLNANTLEEFVSILNIAQKYGFRLIVVSSPVRYLYNTNNLSTKTIENLCDEYGVIFLDNSQLPYFKEHDEYMKDANHLTGEGANVYTDYFLNQLDSLNIN